MALHSDYENFIKTLAANLRRDKFRRVNDALDPVKIAEDLEKKEQLETEFVPLIVNDVITGETTVLPGCYLFYISGYDFYDDKDSTTD